MKAFKIYKPNCFMVFFWLKLRKVHNFCKEKLTRKEPIKDRLVEKTRGQLNKSKNIAKKTKWVVLAKQPAKKNLTPDFFWSQK